MRADRDSANGLFAAAGAGESEPLAARMRPRRLDEFLGQERILGPGRLLRRAIQADQLSSLIFYGPPGSGKTTLARVIANTTTSHFITMNAVLSGIAELRTSIEEAKRERELYGRRTLLFVDEVHRWNKSQQDALLPWVENGTVIFIGATTENPYFEVNRALVSRSRVFRLESLGPAELEETARRALADPERGFGKYDVRLDAEALEHLVRMASGDARSLLNALELAVKTCAPSWPPAAGEEVRVSLEDAEESIQARAVLYDRDGDFHYDVISAFIKSVRGSDPDAALYWLARMVLAGEDPHFIFRRLLISASEDVGLANPGAIAVVNACAEAFDRIGMPEGQFHLAHATLHLATSPKSNSAMGYFDALQLLKKEDAEVPDHLKDSSRDGEELGHGHGYQYPHAWRDHWVAQDYLPEAIRDRVFYHPARTGAEAAFAETLASRRELQLAIAMDGRERGLPRPAADGFLAGLSDRGIATKAGKAGDELVALRDSAFSLALPRREDRCLVLNAGEGLFVWESFRRSPEGLTVGLCGDDAEIRALEDFASRVSGEDKPLLIARDEAEADGIPRRALSAAFGDKAPEFDYFIGRGCLSSSRAAIARLASREARASIGKCAAPGFRLVIADFIPGEGFRPSALVENILGGPAFARYREAEEAFYLDWLGGRSWKEAFAASGWTVESWDETVEESVRTPSPKETAAWFSASSAYGAWTEKALGREFAAVMEQVAAASKKGWAPLSWKRTRVLARLGLEGIPAR